MWLARSSHAASPVSRIAAKMFILFLSWFLLAGVGAQELEEAPFIYEEKYEVCTTEACHTTAAEILNGMDQNTEPCVDFYNFVCKNWRYNYPDIPGLPLRTQFVNAELSFLRKMKTTLETDEDDESNLSEGVQLSKQLYHACMNNDTREEEISLLRNIVRDAGNWALATTGETSMTPESIDSHLSKEFGISWLYDLDVTPDMFKWSRYLLTVNPPQVVRPSFMDGSVEGKRKYAEFVDKVVRMFVGEAEYAGLNKVTLAKDIDELIKFEGAVAAAFGTKDCSYTIVMLKDLQEWSNNLDAPAQVDWTSRLKPLMPNEDERLYLTCPVQILQIMNLTYKHSERVIKNYVIWNFLKRTVPLMDNDLRNTFYGANAHKQRWQQCVEENEALSAVYYHILEKDAENNNDKKAQDVYDVMEAMTAWRFLGLKDRLRGNNLRLEAHELHEKMTIQFKNAEPYFNATDYIDHFPHVNGSNLYVENILAKAKFHQDRLVDLMLKPVDIIKSFDYRPEFDVSPHEAKIQGGAFSKTRYVPAAALEMPFYHKDRPQSVNYGALGSVFGVSFMQEYYDYLAASFKSDPRIVDFPPESRNSYKNNAMFIMNLWDDYPLKNKASKDAVNVNDLNEVYSHHAQSDAVKTAFEAYEREFKLRKWKDIRLPGLEKYDHKQLFFLSYVNAHCATSSRLGLKKVEDMSRAVLNDMDMEARRKVILSLIQSEEFSKVFKCKLGTWMYPHAISRFW